MPGAVDFSMDGHTERQIAVAIKSHHIPLVTFLLPQIRVHSRWLDQRLRSITPVDNERDQQMGITFRAHRPEPRRRLGRQVKLKFEVPVRIPIRHHRRVSPQRGKGRDPYFAGLEKSGQPNWSSDIEARQPAFEDRARGLVRSSVSYNPGLPRYLLASQQVSRWDIRNGHIGIYDSPEPWGPVRGTLQERVGTGAPARIQEHFLQFLEQMAQR